MKPIGLYILMFASTFILSSCTIADTAKTELQNKISQTQNTPVPDKITSAPDSEDQILLDLNTPEPDIDKDLQDLESALK